jgi:hypothetical protein
MPPTSHHAQDDRRRSELLFGGLDEMATNWILSRRRP